MGGLVLLEPEVTPSFPGWVESGARDYISAVFSGLRATLGRSTPALPQAAATPYSIPDGDLGIPAYGETKVVNDAIKTTYDAATRAMAATVGKSATLTVLARNAVTSAVELFNGIATTLVEDDYMGLYGAAGLAIEQARNAVAQLLALQSQPGGLQVYPSWFVGPIPPGAIRAPAPGGPRVVPDTASPETPYDWASAAVTAATGGGEAGATKIVEHATPGRHGIPLGGASAPSVATAGKFLARANFVTGAAATVYGGINDYQNGKTSGTQAITQTAGSLGGGIAGGALAGAAVGSFAGPVGTAVGAGIGAVIGSEVGKSLGKMVGGWFE